MRFAPFVVLAVLAGACSSTSQFGSGLPGPGADAETRAMEHAMFERLNRDRATEGLPPLAYDEKLADIGRAHSDDMRIHQFFAHESPTYGTLDDRLDRAAYVAKVARENLAEAPDMTTAEDGLLKSPGHHANIMANDIGKVGIGIVRGGVKDPRNILFTQEFSTPAREVSADEVRSIVLKKIGDARAKAGGAKPAPNPTLDGLARSLIGDLADNLAQGSLDTIAKKALEGISAAPQSGLKGVVVGAALVYDGDDYEPAPSVVAGASIGIGVAAADAKDERGRPAKKVLVLVGQ